MTRNTNFSCWVLVLVLAHASFTTPSIAAFAVIPTALATTRPAFQESRITRGTRLMLLELAEGAASAASVSVSADVATIVDHVTKPQTKKRQELTKLAPWFSGVRNAILSLSLYVFCIAVSAVKTTAFSPCWFAGIFGISLSSILVACSIPNQTFRPELRTHFWPPAILAAHIFAASSSFLLAGILLKSPSLLGPSLNKCLVCTSMTMTFVGCIAEIIGHHIDGWIFESKSNACNGLSNQVFSISLVGGFSFLAAAIHPTIRNLALAFAFPATMTIMATTDNWCKTVVYSFQSITAGWVASVFIKTCGTAWPLLYFCQAFNIVRNGKQLQNGHSQTLHLLTSLYGWFSYVFPFDFAMLQSDQLLGNSVVLTSCIMSIIGTDMIERIVQQRYIRQQAKNDGRRLKRTTP